MIKECQTFTIEKNWRSQNLSEKRLTRIENLKKCTRFEEWKGKKYITFIFLLSTKLCLRFFFLICFTQEIKVFYQSSLGNEIDFRDIFQKADTWFVDKEGLITTTLISSRYWKTLAAFCLQKETRVKTHF